MTTWIKNNQNYQKEVLRDISITNEPLLLSKQCSKFKNIKETEKIITTDSGDNTIIHFHY